ncbi:MAG: flavin reductase family protein [Actinomycetota bacterium]
MLTLEKPKNYIVPLPVMLVTARLKENGKIKDNIIPLSWVGTVDSRPHLININISNGKYSGRLIKMSRQFGICVPTQQMLEEVDRCGTTHGNKVDKFELTGLSRFEAQDIDVPLIAECPINMECTLEEVYPFHSHEMFVGKIVKTHVDEKYTEDGKPDYSKVDPLCYVDGQYWTLGEKKAKLFYTAGK